MAIDPLCPWAGARNETIQSRKFELLALDDKYAQKLKAQNCYFVDSAAVSIFVVILVELTNTVLIPYLLIQPI